MSPRIWLPPIRSVPIPDDERIEEGEVEESSLQDVNDAVETFRLTRRHVLTSLGRAQAPSAGMKVREAPKR